MGRRLCWMGGGGGLLLSGFWFAIGSLVWYACFATLDQTRAIVFLILNSIVFLSFLVHLFVCSFEGFNISD